MSVAMGALMEISWSFSVFARVLSEYGPAIADGDCWHQHSQNRTDHPQDQNLSRIADEELAAMANMSPSSFHQHFKAVTAMSPLQYLKRLRLTEARHILLSEHADAASTAYRVGYQSVSQFSREYARMFGAPPMCDIESIRTPSMTPAGEPRSTL